ncbi:hypothetical protein IMG5_144230 [Ichthyophthirius multifiliis]|uniref:Uncharacterized protein n=1 Tax=Ichthyophthirius multifiliis TaxID=5932 RepID=G0QXN9_ICHMU|nr:hypothetical protein IMG5_144230 [Ichthyophthirius multifiliis]EGR30020.1 hypothetical protein IMG5_144230 [Ichthyophthirius multifiliis]|eukprot:XP_004031256.1 hypothetical protein IMG5_144230 [Ichthyophthirius multifiliis]
MIKFNFHFIDDWQGEIAFAKINGKTIWHESYAWCGKLLSFQCKLSGVNACGKEIPDRISHNVQFEFINTDDQFILEIGAYLKNRNSCDVSWGIDDVQVYVI